MPKRTQKLVIEWASTYQQNLLEMWQSQEFHKLPPLKWIQICRLPMQYPRISKAKAIDDNTLIIEFSNEEVKEYKIRHLLEKPMFAPLRQPSFFKNFKIEPGGYALVWTDEIDISEYELWKNGTAVTQEAVSNLLK